MRRIASGGHSTIHELRAIDDRARFALKSVRLDATDDAVSLDRFLREARMMMRLRHPSIATVHDVGQVDDLGAYFVLEYVDGETIRSMLGPNGLAVDVGLAIAVQIADALDVAHRAGVVHRDLKPDNVIVARRAIPAEPIRAKLVDFGIARMSGAVGITSPRDLLGTPGYMAPEYVRDGVATEATDQYSLGVLTYEMLSGRLPFDAASSGQLLVKQARTAPIALDERRPGLDPAIGAVVMRALERTPEARFPTIASYRDALGSISDRHGSSS